MKHRGTTIEPGMALSVVGSEPIEDDGQHPGDRIGVRLFRSRVDLHGHEQGHVLWVDVPAQVAVGLGLLD